MKFEFVCASLIFGRERLVPMLGFIAQDVERIIPTVVTHPLIEEKDRAKYEGGGRVLTNEAMDSYTMSYTQLIPVLVNSIQELVEENKKLVERIEKLESK